MVVKDCIVLTGFQRVNIFVQNRLELLDVVRIYFKMDESMAESRVTVSQLKVELSVFQSHLLYVQNFLYELLVRKNLVSIISLVW